MELRNDHPSGHSNENMKHVWQYNMAHLNCLLEEASNITSITTGVDYNDNYDHKYYDTMPPFF